MGSFMQTLKESAFFGGLEENLLNTLVAVGRLKKIEPGRKIMLEESDRIWIVKKGFLKWMMFDEDGSCAAVIMLRPGDVFAAPQSGDGFAGEVEAMTSCYLCNSRKIDFLKLASSSPRLLSRFADSSLGVSHRLGARLANYMTRPALARLAIVLGELAVLPNDSEESHQTLTTPAITQRELAQMVGTTREMVTTMLRKLKKAGIVEGDRHGITILSPADLEKITARGT